MNIKGLGRRIFDSRVRSPLLAAANWLLFQDSLRRILFSVAQSSLERTLFPGPGHAASRSRIEQERALVVRAILATVDRLIGRRQLSPRLVRVILELWGRAWFASGKGSLKNCSFLEANGCEPPWFLVLSPGNACDLRCPGCYADATGAAPVHLPWVILDRVMAEAKAFWGTPLFVFSGGEPLLYQSEGRGVLDAVENHPDSLFLMFTNGSRIDESVARRLERLGNLTPAISVEGLEATTDKRRGKGRFARTLEAMSFLRQAGVPFGISVTVTTSNMEEILSDRFLDFFFFEQGAFYGFLFHYMPIGRGASLNWMPTPTQRMELWRRTWEAIDTKRIFLFDFWNHGPMVGGCLSAGRQGGYLYIDWEGRVMPCVFAPYAVARLEEVYARGETLEDVWKTPFLQAIRDWQRRYGYQGDLVPNREGNWLRPCPIRDHYPLFREWLDRFRPEPENEAAREAWESSAYLEGLSAYGRELQKISEEIWREVYVHPTFPGCGRHWTPGPPRQPYGTARSGNRNAASASPKDGRAAHERRKSDEAQGNSSYLADRDDSPARPGNSSGGQVRGTHRSA